MSASKYLLGRCCYEKKSHISMRAHNCISPGPNFSMESLSIIR